MNSLLIGRYVMVKERLVDTKWNRISGRLSEIWEMPYGFTWGKSYRIEAHAPDGLLIIINDKGGVVRTFQCVVLPACVVEECRDMYIERKIQVLHRRMGEEK